MLSPDLLSQNMLQAFRANMLKFSPEAKPQEFQQIICLAISNGLISSIQQAVATAIAPSPIVTGQGLGITIQADLCKNVAIAKLVSYFGGKGDALDYILDAIYQTSASHLLQFTDVISVSGFGGQAGGIQNAPPELIANLIIANLPAQNQQQILSSQFGRFFIQGVADGFSAGLQAAIPAIVPFGTTPPPPGILIAKFQ